MVFITIQKIRDVFDSINFYDACPDCRGTCCYLPWMPQEEYELVKILSDNVGKIENTNFFAEHERCKLLDGNGMCTIYDIRPLDCRLFPLDIIEENGQEREKWTQHLIGLNFPIKEDDPIEYWGKFTPPVSNFITGTRDYPWIPTRIVFD